MSEFKAMKASPVLGGRPILPWNDRADQPLVRRQDPETCHCGKPALYRHPTKHDVGFCKDHKADAEKVTAATRHRSER